MELQGRNNRKGGYKEIEDIVHESLLILTPFNEKIGSLPLSIHIQTLTITNPI